MAHRYLYEETVAKLPPEIQLDHLCRNRRCVNVNHLEPVTGAENRRRGESPVGINSRKTSCNHGHPLSGDNLYVYSGHRCCKECRRKAATDYYHRRRAIEAVRKGVERE